MPHIQIIGPEPHPGNRSPHAAHGTRVLVDGKELQDIRDVVVKFPVDGVVEAHVEMYVTDQFVFTGGADLHLHIHLMPGQELYQAGNVMMVRDKEKV